MHICYHEVNCTIFNWAAWTNDINWTNKERSILFEKYITIKLPKYLMMIHKYFVCVEISLIRNIHPLIIMYLNYIRNIAYLLEHWTSIFSHSEVGFIELRATSNIWGVEKSKIDSDLLFYAPVLCIMHSIAKVNQRSLKIVASFLDKVHTYASQHMHITIIIW